MQLKYKGKVIYSYSWRRLLYALCFCMFCLIDQRTKTCSGLDGWLESFRDLTGVVMAVIIMSHYRLEDFRKRKVPYLVWSVVSVVGGIAAIWWGKNNYYFFNDWIVKVIDVVLFGYILIHTFISVVLEKQYPKLNKKFAITWLVMMVLMIVSRSTYIWPFCYLVMFGCFYLTDYSKEEQDDLFQGMLDGIILGFFLLQGLCFVFRPYDLVRYTGIHNNPNLNALFYLEVLAAVFAKLVYVTKHQCSKWVRLYYWVGAGVVLSFELLTIGRAGWLTAIIFVGLFLWFLCKIQASKRWLKNLLALSLCVVLTFPLCFTAVRYLPPVFHHPVWFWGEWSEQRVHSWDPWDSEKFIDIDEYFDAALGRIVESFENLLEHSPLAIKSEAAELASDGVPTTEATVEAVQEELPPNKIPVLTTYEETSDSFIVRSTIYKYYFQHLNIFGHPYEEQGFQLAEYYWIGHAHNIFLQYGTDFGIPVMILFLLLIVWGSFSVVKKFERILSAQSVGDLLFLLIPALFGMFEYAWGVGSLTITMLFIAWRNVVRDEE